MKKQQFNSKFLIIFALVFLAKQTSCAVVPRTIASDASTTISSSDDEQQLTDTDKFSQPRPHLEALKANFKKTEKKLIEFVDSCGLSIIFNPESLLVTEEELERLTKEINKQGSSITKRGRLKELVDKYNKTRDDYLEDIKKYLFAEFQSLPSKGSSDICTFPYYEDEVLDDLLSGYEADHDDDESSKSQRTRR